MRHTKSTFLNYFNLFFRCSTASRLKTLKTGLKVSQTFVWSWYNVISVDLTLFFFVPILGEQSYPRLRILLQFDTQEFLNVLSMVSDFMWHSLFNLLFPEHMFVVNSLKLFFAHLRINNVWVCHFNTRFATIYKI